VNTSVSASSALVEQKHKGNEMNTNPSVIEHKNRFTDAITHPEMAMRWDNCLDAWEEGTLNQKSEAMTWICAYRDRCLAAYMEVDDVSAMYTLGAVSYIEMKAHWTMLNTQVNYQNAVKGQADMTLAVRASLTTTLLLALEEVLSAQDIDHIIEFLSEPVNSCKWIQDQSGTTSPNGLG